MVRKVKLNKKDLGISRICFNSLSPQSTYQLAKHVGHVLNVHTVLCLFGELGAGKTIFVKGIADAFGVEDAWNHVVSPSFLIVKEYDAPISVVHVDLYRINHLSELISLGLQEYFAKECILVIEWAQRATHLLPERCVNVYFDVQGIKKRKIKIEGLDSEQTRVIRSKAGLL